MFGRDKSIKMKKYFGVKEKMEGETIPRGYGIAYWDIARNYAICYPLGINWIVRFFRALHYRLAVPLKKTKFEVRDIAMYDKGYNDATSAAKIASVQQSRRAFKRGYQEGWDARMEDLKSRLDIQSDIKSLELALWAVWSKETAFNNGARWNDACPSIDQCAVTALIVQDYFGGDLMRCPTEKQDSHYYNQLANGEIVDLTEGQFEYIDDAPIKELVVVRDRAYVLSFPDTLRRYQILKEKLVYIYKREEHGNVAIQEV